MSVMKGDVEWYCLLDRLSHFDYVKAEDLKKIGIGKPAIRRLVDAVKKKRRKKSVFDKVCLKLITCLHFYLKD